MAGAAKVKYPYLFFRRATGAARRGGATPSAFEAVPPVADSTTSFLITATCCLCLWSVPRTWIVSGICTPEQIESGVFAGYLPAISARHRRIEVAEETGLGRDDQAPVGAMTVSRVEVTSWAMPHDKYFR